MTLLFLNRVNGYGFGKVIPIKFYVCVHICIHFILCFEEKANGSCEINVLEIFIAVGSYCIYSERKSL